jgi:uncharacterized protein YndB with AHSA1/START domain
VRIPAEPLLPRDGVARSDPSDDRNKSTGGSGTAHMAAPIILDRDLDVPVEEVWTAWTDEASAIQWLAPAARIEPKLGGIFELFWEPGNPSGTGTPGSTISTITEEYMLRFGWKGPPQFASLINGPPLATRVTARFQPLGPGRTRLRIEHEGWEDGEPWTEARGWHERMWADALARLKTLLGPP